MIYLDGKKSVLIYLIILSKTLVSSDILFPISKLIYINISVYVSRLNLVLGEDIKTSEKSYQNKFYLLHWPIILN